MHSINRLIIVKRKNQINNVFITNYEVDLTPHIKSHISSWSTKHSSGWFLIQIKYRFCALIVERWMLIRSQLSASLTLRSHLIIDRFYVGANRLINARCERLNSPTAMFDFRIHLLWRLIMGAFSWDHYKTAKHNHHNANDDIRCVFDAVICWCLSIVYGLAFVNAAVEEAMNRKIYLHKYIHIWD